MVDPIDGTRDYIRGRIGWCVSVALVEDGQPVIGVLDAPARDEMWIAAAGRGAWRNGGGSSASARARAGGRARADRRLPQEDRDLVVVAKPNSIALRIAMVAADEADLLATLRWGNEWDIAAAVLIAARGGRDGDRRVRPAAGVQHAERAGVRGAGDAPGSTAAVARLASGRGRWPDPPSSRKREPS